MPDLSQDKFTVVGKLEDIFRSEHNLAQGAPIDSTVFDSWADIDAGRPDAKEIDQWRLKLANGQTISTEDLRRWLRAIKKQSDDQSRLTDLRGRIAEIDARAQTLIKVVYTKLKPQLPQLIKSAINAPSQRDESALSFLNPRLVLDSSTGIHVIYQTLWLACVLILILAVVFVLVVALRPLPFFARATDTIKERADELFKRSESARPQLAKSLVVTAAALGVGTAVAVSSTSAVGKRPPQQVGQPYIDGGGPTDGNSGGGGGGLVKKAEVVEHVITFSPPIVYPSPVTFSGPDKVTVDAASFEPLSTAIKNIRTNSPSGLSDTELRQRIGDVAQSVTETALTRKLGTVDVPALFSTSEGFKTQLGTLERDLGGATSQLTDLSKWKSGVEKNFSDTLASLRDQLADTNRVVEDLRNDSLERPQNSGGRNLLTRAGQVFGRNKHMVTAQTVRALSNLMIKLPVGQCAEPNTSPPVSKPCCETKPTNARYSCNLDIDALITKLTAIVGDAPQDETTFMKQLRLAQRVDGQTVSKSVVDQWKSVILKYTRSAY